MSGVADMMELLTGMKQREQSERDGPWFEALDKRQREQTAATILAALIPILNAKPVETSKEAAATIAVAWADALRAALRGGE